MIGKKIANPRRSTSKSARVHGLVDYIRNPEKKGAEKAVFVGSRGFVSEDHELQKEEMVALSHAAVRSRDPINHYVLSWKEGEEPSSKQAERAVGLVLKEMGMEKHQAFYSLHADTRLWHLHLVVSRVNPETEKVVSPNRGKDKELLHRAVARIEKEQGWESVDRPRYRVNEKGEVERIERSVPAEKREPRAKNQDREVRSGEKSAERVAQEVGARVMGRARTWRELHEGLAKEGLRYEKKGSGAVLFVGNVPVKGSVVGREYSFSALQKRLGLYEKAPKESKVERRPPEPKGPPKPSWREWREEKTRYEAEKKASWRELKREHESDQKELRQETKAKREALFSENWKGRGRELNVRRSLLAGETAVSRAEMKSRHKEEKAAWESKYKEPFPSFEKWSARQRNQDKQEEKRVGRGEPALPLRSKNRVLGEEEVKPRERDIRDFSAVVVRQEVRYERKDDQKVSFVDRARRVDVYDRSEESVKASLQLGVEKWGSVKVEGDKEFVDRAVELAAIHNFKLSNPELQTRVTEERERLLMLAKELVERTQRRERGFELEDVVER